VVELCREALTEVAPLRGGALYVLRDARPEPVEQSLGAEVAAGSVVVGTLDGAVVAYAVAAVEDLRDGRRLGRIDDLYVEPPARGVGVGEAVMGALLERFRAAGCAGVDAVALPGARETKNFFEASGFSARLLVMHHRMEPPT
jgi:ribosomal protein S18 acetylase RimI-like enzyme